MALEDLILIELFLSRHSSRPGYLYTLSGTTIESVCLGKASESSFSLVIALFTTCIHRFVPLINKGWPLPTIALRFDSRYQ
jgi:hypothetical protein